jgi:hypothetical protein
MVPTFLLNKWKVFDNLHMLWMGIWIHHYAIITTSGEVSWNPASLLGFKRCHCAVIETCT